jgi:hypothetical protein
VKRSGRAAATNRCIAWSAEREATASHSSLLTPRSRTLTPASSYPERGEEAERGDRHRAAGRHREDRQRGQRGHRGADRGPLPAEHQQVVAVLAELHVQLRNVTLMPITNTP